MSEFVSPSAGQTGVPRLEEKAPTFEFFQWVASSVSVEDGSEREGFEDDGGAMATHGGMDAGVMVAGTLLLHAQKRMPMKGDVLLAKDEEGFWEEKFLEVVECQASGLVNGRPAACEVTLMLNAAKQAEYAAAGVADLDGPLPIVVMDQVVAGVGQVDVGPVDIDPGNYLVSIEVTEENWETSLVGQSPHKVFANSGDWFFSSPENSGLGELHVTVSNEIEFKVEPGGGNQSGTVAVEVTDSPVGFIVEVNPGFMGNDSARFRVVFIPV